MATKESVNIVNESYKDYMKKIRDITVSGYKKLTKQVNEQNATIDKELKRLSEESSPDFQRSSYEFEAVQKLLNIKTYLVYIFFIILIGLAIALYFNKDFSMVKKAGIFLLVALLPVYIYYIEYILYVSWTYVYSLATSQIYSDVYMNGY